MKPPQVRRFLRDCGLSLVLGTLFLVFLVGQTLAGWAHYNQENQRHGEPAVGLGAYVQTGAYGEAVFENWESEFLQMGLYVVLTVFLFQRGSAESKDPDAPESASEKKSGEVPGPARRGGLVRFIYGHSLSLAFFALFALSFLGHAVCGLAAVNEDAAAHGEPLTSLLGYLASSQFWFESLQNWQSEFLAILAIVVLSIWLREEGSPESKALDAPHSQTGE
jgi:hypothetical protein